MLHADSQVTWLLPSLYSLLSSHTANRSVLTFRSLQLRLPSTAPYARASSTWTSFRNALVFVLMLSRDPLVFESVESSSFSSHRALQRCSPWSHAGYHAVPCPCGSLTDSVTSAGESLSLRPSFTCLVQVSRNSVALASVLPFGIIPGPWPWRWPACCECAGCSHALLIFRTTFSRTSTAVPSSSTSSFSE